MVRILVSSLFIFLVVVPQSAQAYEGIVANHMAVDQFSQIPEPFFQTIRDSSKIFYGHTSHGSQIVSGLDLLVDEDPYLFEKMMMTETGGDLGHNGDTAWVRRTHDHLDIHPECTVVMWSWCGGCSDNTAAGINIYLQAMTALEAEYPDVLFVYMTGHLDGTGPEGNLYRSNNQIRKYCTEYAKTLYDFADIESWSPDGHYHPYETDACEWCEDWCIDNDCSSCYCAHSHCFNCYRKGMAFWWLMARAHGWKNPSVSQDIFRRNPHFKGAHPNPFNPTTTLTFSLPQSGTAKIVVLDAVGRVVVTLADRYYGAGEHSIVWNGRDAAGREAPSGTYLTRIDIDGAYEVQRISLIK